MDTAPAATHPLPPLPAQVRLAPVLHSIERPGLTPVFGTTVPPSGLSGQLRRLAFRWSEGDLRHWMLLLLADRVNVGEGLLADLARGHIPNLWAEMGLRAEWRHNRWRFLVKMAMLVGLASVIWAWLRRRAPALGGRARHVAALGWRP